MGEELGTKPEETKKSDVDTSRENIDRNIDVFLEGSNNSRVAHDAIRKLLDKGYTFGEEEDAILKQAQSILERGRQTFAEELGKESNKKQVLLRERINRAGKSAPGEL